VPTDTVAERKPASRARARGSRLPVLLGAAILGAQLCSIAYAHFGPAPDGQSWTRKTLNGCSAEPAGCRRYFAWAPNDYAVEFRLNTTVGARRLSFADSLRRYHLPPSSYKNKGYWEDPPQRLIDTIGRYERTHDERSSKTVVLSYRVNGGDRHVWRWAHR
jgi:hypothetical protein